MNKKTFVAFGVIILVVVALCMQATVFAAEKEAFFDDFDVMNTDRWNFVNSNNGRVELQEYEGRNVIALIKGGTVVGSAPNVTLKENIGESYTATAVVKMEQAEREASIKSFEYVYFYLTTGTGAYRLQWFYNSSEFQLQKGGSVVRRADYSKLAGYEKYGWNEYTFEVTENWIKILINGREVIYHEDSSLSPDTFKFMIGTQTMWALNVAVYIDSVAIYDAPEDEIMIDPKYTVKLTSEGKIRISGKVYAPADNQLDKAVLIGALYDDDTLKGTAKADITLPKGKRSGEFSLEFDSEDLFRKLDVKIMLWKDMDSLMPISDALSGISGYYIEDFDVLPESNAICNINFDNGIENLEVMSDSCQAGGYRVEKVNGNNVLKVFSGYAKTGTQRSFGVVLPDTYDSFVMDVTLRSRRFLSESASVILGYRGENDYYAVTWTQEAFPNLWEKRPAQKFRLCQNDMADMVLGKPEEIMDDEAPFIPQSYRIFVFSDKILVYRKPDGTPIFDFTSDSPIEPGKIGFGVSGKGSGNTQFYVDDIKIWSLDTVN